MQNYATNALQFKYKVHTFFLIIIFLYYGFYILKLDCLKKLQIMELDCNCILIIAKILAIPGFMAPCLHVCASRRHTVTKNMEVKV